MATLVIIKSPRTYQQNQIKKSMKHENYSTASDTIIKVYFISTVHIALFPSLFPMQRHFSQISSFSQISWLIELLKDTLFPRAT